MSKGIAAGFAILSRALDGAHMSSAQSRFTARLLTALTLVGCLLGTRRTDSQRWNTRHPKDVG